MRSLFDSRAGNEDQRQQLTFDGVHPSPAGYVHEVLSQTLRTLYSVYLGFIRLVMKTVLSICLLANMEVSKQTWIMRVGCVTAARTELGSATRCNIH